ncbi:MAG: cohesin domain-containing protein [bacterium]
MNLLKWGSMMGILTLLLTGCGGCGGGGNSPTEPDQTPPAISNSSITPSAERALVYWETDKPATSQVNYGPSMAAIREQKKTDETYVEEHVVHLSALNPDKTYYLMISSTDQSGNANEPQILSFTTSHSALVMSPLLVDVKRKETFTIEIRAENVTNLFGTAFDLKFDSDYLEVDEVDEEGIVFGDFLENPLTFNMLTGNILSIATTQTNSGAGMKGVSGSGLLVTVPFKAKKAGNTQLNLTISQMLDSNGESHPDLNQIRIVGGKVNIR